MRAAVRGSSSAQLVPTSTPCIPFPSATPTNAGGSSSNLPTAVRSVSNRRPTSSMTSAKISSGCSPSATSVAMRRNVACSAATRSSACRASAFATAVATRSVNWPSRASDRSGIDEFQPKRRAMSAASPEASSYPSTRAGLPVSATSVNTLWPPRTERVPTGTPTGDALQLPIAVAAPKNRDVGVEQLGNLRRNCLEDLGGRDITGDERRHPPQRRLLLRKPREGFARFGIGDRRRDELRELCEPLLCVARKVVPPVDRHCSPKTAVDDDRTGDLRQVAVMSEELGDFAAGRHEVIGANAS